MGREIDSFQDLVMELSKIDSMPEPRVKKCQSFYELAGNVEKGVIVELGTYHGIGAIALYHGSLHSYYVRVVPVITVDDYIDRTGWAGESYVPTDLLIARNNFKKMNADITQVIGNATKVPNILSGIKIGMLVWDTGSYLVEKEVSGWLPMVIPGGFVAFHDTDMGTLNAVRFCTECCDTPEWEGPFWWKGGVVSMTKVYQ